MGFLDRLFGKKKPAPARPPAAPPRRYPDHSLVHEADLRSVADFDRHYPLPAGFHYEQRGQRPADIVVVRESDGQAFIFLVEEGILGFDVPHQKADGTWGKRTTEVLRRG
ncbi:MAG: hypothetical protein PVF47_14575 [Anaerolineae bacterium]|jgi:hypothetical protein